MEQIIRHYTILAVLIFIYFFFSFFYFGITTIPTEGDSLAYHIPIAKAVLSGNILSPSNEGLALEFYPGNAEVILSILMLLHMPLNLYNLLGWVILAFLCVRLGVSFRLTGSLPIIYAVSATTVLAMIRLLPNQTIDIWLAVFFTWSLLLLRHPEKSLRYFLYLGTALGLLIGSKFSGPLYAVVLFLFFGQHMLSYVNVRRFIVFLVPFMVFGLSWYLRNIYLKGNPFYPQEILFLQGNENFRALDWNGWKTIFFYPNGVFLMLLAFFEEYMVWSIAPFIGIYYFVRERRKREVLSQDMKSLIGIGIVNLLIFFFLPSTGNNIIANLRFVFTAFIPLILFMFLLAEKQKKLSFLLPLAIMNSVLLFSLTAHRPKLFFLFLLAALGILYIYPRLERVLLRA